MKITVRLLRTQTSKLVHLNGVFNNKSPPCADATTILYNSEVLNTLL